MPAGKKKVVLAALKLFSEKGFDGTSTQEIATESGMSQATIFKYFKTKEDLLVFIISPVMQNIIPPYLNDFKKSLESKKDDLGSFVHYIVRSRYDFLVENQEVSLIVISAILTKDNIKAKFIEMLSERGGQIFQVFSDLANKSGEIRSDLKPESIIRLMVSQVLIYFLQNYKIFSTRESKQVDQDLNEIEKLIISAIQK